ncbi:hypothetical protein ACHAWU_000035 [Discostella pseudostelligera]|uniref:Uncharacterized protein n=1 Tax=Discostella pseudostelligera TaxID=259834 RepID=A0ABD3M9E9_9STRA
MSFFHRSEGRGKAGIGIAVDTDGDGSAAWCHPPTGSAASPSPSSKEDHFNDGALPATSTATATTGVVFSSNWAQERSCQQQIDLENELLLNNNNATYQISANRSGCCQNVLLILIQGLHIFNIIILGMGLLVYGSLVLQNGHQQQHQLQLDQLLLHPQRQLHQHLQQQQQQQQQLYHDWQYASSSSSASLVPLASLQSNDVDVGIDNADIDNNIAHSQSPEQSPSPPPPPPPSSSSSDRPSSDEQSQPQSQQSQQQDQQNQQQQAMAAVLFCLILGTIHLFSSGIGLLSLFLLLPNNSNNFPFKWGYRISAYIGPYLSLLYISILISLLVDSDGFILYLTQNAKSMYLNENVIENVRTIWLPVVYTMLVILGMLESIRYCVLMSEYQELVAQEAEEEEGYIPRSGMSTSSSPSRSARSNSLRSSGRTGGGGRSRNKVSANETLTQALLQDSIDAEEAAAAGAEGVQSKTSVDPNNWWEN